jgi:hypothetical protein
VIFKKNSTESDKSFYEAVKESDERRRKAGN